MEKDNVKFEEIIETDHKEVLYAKTSKFERAELSDDYLTYNPTNEEIVEKILLRLAHRFNQEECDYFKEFTGQPIDCMDLDQSNEYSATTAVIRKYLKHHLENPKAYPSPFKFEKINNLYEYTVKLDKKKLKPKSRKVIDNNIELSQVNNNINKLIIQLSKRDN